MEGSGSEGTARGAGLLPDSRRVPPAIRGLEYNRQFRIARMFDPKLRMDLGYYYSEFVGIHDNYERYNQFTEREILPRLAAGT